MLRPLLWMLQWKAQGIPFRVGWSMATAKCYLGSRPWWRRRYDVDHWIVRGLVVLAWLTATAVLVFTASVAFAAAMYLLYTL